MLHAASVYDKVADEERVDDHKQQKRNQQTQKQVDCLHRLKEGMLSR